MSDMKIKMLIWEENFREINLSDDLNNTEENRPGKPEEPPRKAISRKGTIRAGWSFGRTIELSGGSSQLEGWVFKSIQVSSWQPVSTTSNYSLLQMTQVPLRMKPPTGFTRSLSCGADTTAEGE